jgi:glycosyltransferase involved in cell wall biosynthesis
MEDQHMKLVSVNITTFNRADLIPRCLDSVLKQSYENVEIVVVDDCSTDHTAQVMETYVEQYGYIKYIRHEKNQGNAQARNTALAHCNGYYVAFMDDDDEWIDPDKLQKQVDTFERQDEGKLGIVCSSVKTIASDGKEVLKIEKHPKDLVAHILRKNGIIHNSTVLTKKSIMERVGGFDQRMPRGVDSEFFRTLIVDYGYRVLFMPDITTAYYEHAGLRMTTDSKNVVLKTFKGNYRVVTKHYSSFLRHPGAFLARVFLASKKIFKTILQ